MGVARFVPYVGPILSAAAPILMSLAVFDNWTSPLLVIGLIIALELVHNMLVEPMVYGQGIGASEIALLVMIAFWTWLWGPIGTVLAAPLTVCLMVLSKSVPDLQFINVLLSDEPALTPHQALYQRLIARDEGEVLEIIERFQKNSTREQLFEELIMPTLVSCRRDLQRERVNVSDQDYVIQFVRRIIDNPPTANCVTVRRRDDDVSGDDLLVGFPAYDQADEMGLLMLAELLRQDGRTLIVLSSEILLSEALSEVERWRPAAVCISCLPGGSMFAARQFCKRLRLHGPAVPLTLAHWHAENPNHIRRQFSEWTMGFGGTLAEVRSLLNHLSPTSPVPTRGNGKSTLTLQETEFGIHA
jgi:hypothetical protein